MRLSEADFPVCEFCGMPTAMHAGFDHGRSKCLLATSELDLVLLHGKSRAPELAAQIRAWLAAQDTKEAAMNDLGAFI